MKDGHHRRGRVDLSHVKLAATDAAADAIHRGIQEAVGQALESERSYLDLPAVWGHTDRGGRKDDPLTLEIGIDVGREDLDLPTYRVNLRDILAEYIAYCREDGLFAEGLAEVAQGLRRLADELDDAVRRPGHG